MTANLQSLPHLARRFVGMLSRRPVPEADLAWVGERLFEHEAELWHRMPLADQRHSVAVARRFEAEMGDPTRAEMAGALLHDIGKLRCGLGVWSRTLATIVGPRTQRFRAYLAHEPIGAVMLEQIGSEPTTVALVRGSSDSRAAVALRVADDL